MLILGRDTMKDPALGYARTFVRQLEDCLGLALERGVKIVSNAGGLNPAGLADRLREVAQRARPRRRASRTSRATTSARSASYDGALTANAYLGGFGIAAALAAGADVVVTGRVTDASRRGRPGRRAPRLDADVVRRAGRRRRRRPRHRVRRPGHRRQLLRLPRAGQARHGSRSAAGLPDRRDRRRRLERDHQARRHRRRGHRRHRHRAAGLRDPVDPLPQPRRHRRTSTRSSSTQDGPDRVAVTGVRGEAPPERLKVCVNELGGFRNQRRVRAHRPRRRGEGRRGCARSSTPLADRRRTSTWSRVALPPPDADTEEGASVLLRCTVHGPAARPGRPRVHRPGGRAGARVVPRLHDDHPAAASRRRTASTGPSTSTARRCTTPSCTPTAAARRSPTRPSSRSPTPTWAAAPRRTPRRRDSLNRRMPLGHLRARPLRRQGRRRQHRPLGRPRRRPAARGPRAPGWPS